MLLNAYAAQCAKCYKWRFIQSQEEYSRIRSRSPFECNNCEEPEVDVLCNWSTISCLLGGSHPFILKRDIKSSSDVLPFQNGEATKKRKGDMREETVERNMKKEYAAKKQVEPVIIEEIDKGKIDGKVATQGKKVSIYYTGKVKGRGKLFDSNIGEAPLRFRLGGEKGCELVIRED